MPNAYLRICSRRNTCKMLRKYEIFKITFLLIFSKIHAILRKTFFSLVKDVKTLPQIKKPGVVAEELGVTKYICLRGHVATLFIFVIYQQTKGLFIYWLHEFPLHAHCPECLLWSNVCKCNKYGDFFSIKSD